MSPSNTLSLPIQSAVTTRAIADDALERVARGTGNARHRWQRIIDNQLVEWGLNRPEPLDDGYLPLTRKAIELACLAATKFRDENRLTPTRLSPTPEGGIVFEVWTGNQLTMLEIDPDGSVELIKFEGDRITSRERQLF